MRRTEHGANSQKKGAVLTHRLSRLYYNYYNSLNDTTVPRGSDPHL